MGITFAMSAGNPGHQLIMEFMMLMETLLRQQVSQRLFRAGRLVVTALVWMRYAVSH